MFTHLQAYFDQTKQQSILAQGADVASDVILQDSEQQSNRLQKAQPCSLCHHVCVDLEELDDAQEQLLKWMLYTDEEAQEEDLDEMVDYDELGAEEYEDIMEGELSVTTLPNLMQRVIEGLLLATKRAFPHRASIHLLLPESRTELHSKRRLKT